MYLPLPLRTRTRAALAEIPFRMERLQVSTDEMPLTLHHMHTTIINSPNIDINNIPLSYLTPTPSPDELIIRQRGKFYNNHIIYRKEAITITLRSKRPP